MRCIGNEKTETMKRLFIITCAALCCAGALRAQFACNSAVPLSQEFEVTLPFEGSYWFSAWTYDLPISIDFVPASDDCLAAPKAELDFTCTPGVYDDPNLDNLFNGDDSGGAQVSIEMPYRLTFDSIMKDGKKVYNISLKKDYRDMLSMVGITYDVQAFVKVTFVETGEVKLVPDTLYRNCQTHSHKMELGETVDVAMNDDRVYVLPYSEWINDSIRYVWHGARSTDSVTIWLAHSDCNFELSNDDPKVWRIIGLGPTKPMVKFTAEEVENNIHDFGTEGIFYAVFATSPGSLGGQLTVEQVPATEEGTLPLNYNSAVSVTGNDHSQAYYITRADWMNATSFTATTDKPVKIYASTTSAAPLDAADPRVLAVWTLSKENSGSAAYFSGKDMTDLWSLIDAEAKYIYLRFDSPVNTSVTAHHWSASDCEEDSRRIAFGNSFAVAKSATNDKYRFRKADIDGDTLLITWTGTKTNSVYISDTCVYPLKSNNVHVMKFFNAAANSDVATVVLPSEINGWNTDSEGYLYVRFNAAAAGTALFEVKRSTPQEPDPGDDPGQGDDPTPHPQPTGTMEPVEMTGNVPAGATVGCNCSDLNMKFYVTEAQHLRLYDSHGNLVDEWDQTPSDPPHEYTPVCGVQYTLQGKKDTVKIVR